MSSLTSYLAKKGAVTPPRLQKALLNQAIKGGSTSLSLLEVGAIEEDRLVEMTGKFHRLSTVGTAACLGADPDLVRSLPRTRCGDHMIVAVRREEHVIVMACVEPPARTILSLMEKDLGGRIRLVIASPVAVALALALHHGVALDPRVAAMARSLGEEALGLGLLPDKLAERARAVIAEEPAAEPEPEVDEPDEEEERIDDGGEVPASDPGRSSMVGKYIIVNRIGARRRRPSVASKRPGELDEDRPEGRAGSTEVTFTDGSVKASDETRPKRPSSRPPPPPKRPSKGDSVPPAVLTEVLDDYLESDVRPPPRIRAERLTTPSRIEAPARQDGALRQAPRQVRDEAQDEVKVTRTVALTPEPGEPVKPDRSPEPVEGPPEQEPARQGRPSMKTLPGVAVVEGMAEARDGEVQGYSVEVPELKSLSEVLVEIEEAEKAGDITDAVHNYALQFFDFILMLKYRRGRFELAAASSRGWAWPLEKLPSQVMGYDQIPETIRKMGQPFLGPVDPDGAIAGIIRAVGRPLPANGMLMPISVKGRAIVILYGDNAERATTFEEVHDLFHSTWVATNCLLALLEERRR